eukprot:MONOS_13698.1-p1 / transcript=MONOS_13698.1 / gene=MONOS_13698 / organism=Monocercomonoides_exilis_PA203 / gene_product=unspecified product / transcript_product=unspecified product / location=Mono_scaffold00867:4348-6856(+) / protein_length=562 / sequence_SO=supercontig / SO=protein_coding / is_pseudo=false
MKLIQLTQVHINKIINKIDASIQRYPVIFATSSNVWIGRLDFLFDPSFSNTGSAVVCHTDGHLSLSFVQFVSSATSSATSPAEHSALLNFSLLAIENGHLTVDNSYVKHLTFSLLLFLLSAADRVALANINLQHLQLLASTFEFRQFQSALAHSVAAEHLVFSQGSVLCLPATTTGDIAFPGYSFRNCSNTSTDASFKLSAFSASSPSSHISLSNFTCSQYDTSSGNDADEPGQRGSIISASNAADLSLTMCVFEGAPSETTESANGNGNSADSICSWNASLVHLCNTTAAISDLIMANASDGTLCVSGGADSIEDAKPSPFFIPTLYFAEDVNNETKSEFAIRYQGELLLHCNLSFSLATTIGTEALLHLFELEAKGLVSVKEAFGKIQGSIFREAPAEAYLSVCQLFGNKNALSSTNSFILKNISGSESNGDERIVEKGKEGKSWALIIAVVFVASLSEASSSSIFPIFYLKSVKRIERIQRLIKSGAENRFPFPSHSSKTALQQAVPASSPSGQAPVYLLSSPPQTAQHQHFDSSLFPLTPPKAPAHDHPVPANRLHN